jgi:hypothetical protein
VALTPRLVKLQRGLERASVGFPVIHTAVDQLTYYGIPAA